jgi:hypothetical protein
MAKSEFLSRANAVHEELQKAGEVFTVSEWYLRTLAACQGLQAVALEAAVAGAVEKADKESAPKRGRSEQGELFVLNGDYRLRNQERIATRKARRDHMQTAIGLSDENLEAVREANGEIHREFDLLSPFWKAGMTKEEAVAAFQAAQSGAA